MAGGKMNTGYKLPKTFSGEKYIYLTMAYRLAEENGGKVKIGNDNGFVGGQNYERWFYILDYKGITILQESKSSSSSAIFSRYFTVTEGEQRLTIREYFDENRDNCSERWEH